VSFWQFFREGWAVPCKCGPQKCIIAFEKFFLFWVPMNIWKDWKAKLESAYSFMLKYSKITVWALSENLPKWHYLTPVNFPKYRHLESNSPYGTLFIKCLRICTCAYLRG
jgi:hypothetical protein